LLIIIKTPGDKINPFLLRNSSAIKISVQERGLYCIFITFSAINKEIRQIFRTRYPIIFIIPNIKAFIFIHFSFSNCRFLQKKSPAFVPGIFPSYLYL